MLIKNKTKSVAKCGRLVNKNVKFEGFRDVYVLLFPVLVHNLGLRCPICVKEQFACIQIWVCQQPVLLNDLSFVQYRQCDIPALDVT